jgi:preprotein translocase subunit Sec63
MQLSTTPPVFDPKQ